MIGQLVFAVVMLWSASSRADRPSLIVDHSPAIAASRSADPSLPGPAIGEAATTGLRVAAGETGSDNDDAQSNDAGADEPLIWHATAYALWKDGKGQAHVAVGYSGPTDTSDRASEIAIESCERSSNGHACTAIGPFSAGCVYITTGSSTRGVSYGNGATPEDATKQCRQGKRYKCQKPIGGCLD